MIVNKLTLNSPLLPKYFRDIPDAPKQLYYKGTLEDFAQTPRLAVVGSRKATPYGRAVTTKLVSELASYGVLIVSGLALGIDSIAHTAALDAGGVTVAVLANGLDRVYPVSHTQLAQRLLEQDGALISEYAEGSDLLNYHFIARNRLISGLSDAVLIPEAAERSGSLHTAGFALEQGKTVMAVPGNISSPMSAGTNNLIKAGALPVTSTEDVLAAMGLNVRQLTKSISAANEQEARVLELLEQGITDAAELLIKSELDVATFNQTLTILEISGKIRPLSAGHWSIK